MKLSIKWLLPFSLLLLVAMLDVSQRLTITNNATAVQGQKTDIANRYPLRLNQAQYQTLSTLLAEYKQTKAEAEPSEQAEPTGKKAAFAAMSASEQAQQSGRLDFLYIGPLRYQLLGIFTKQRDVAVLKQQNIETEATEIVNLQQGQQLGDYRVAQIQPTRIHFVANDQRQISLQLFDIHPSGQPD